MMAAAVGSSPSVQLYVVDGRYKKNIEKKQKKYTEKPQERDAKKTALETIKKANPEAADKSKSFDRVVSVVNVRLEDVNRAVDELVSAKVGPTPKHLQRAVAYVRTDLLFHVVTSLLEKGATPTDKCLKEARNRFAETGVRAAFEQLTIEFQTAEIQRTLALLESRLKPQE